MIGEPVFHVRIWPERGGRWFRRRDGWAWRVTESDVDMLRTDPTWSGWTETVDRAKEMVAAILKYRRAAWAARQAEDRRVISWTETASGI